MKAPSCETCGQRLSWLPLFDEPKPDTVTDYFDGYYYRTHCPFCNRHLGDRKSQIEFAEDFQSALWFNPGMNHFGRWWSYK